MCVLLQLCDFGLARSLGKPVAGASPGGVTGAGGVAPDVEDDDGGTEAKLTEYVVTRWWRAPEVRQRSIIRTIERKPKHETKYAELRRSLHFSTSHEDVRGP